MCEPILADFFWHISWVKCRKVTTHKCPHMNVLCAAMHKCWHGTYDGWWGKLNQGKSSENWIDIHLSSFSSVNRNRISVSAIMKKLKNGCHFINVNHTEKFQITDLPKFGSPVFWVSTEMEYQHRPLWKNWKMAAISLILIIQKNFKLLTLQSWGLWFSEWWRKWDISISHYEKIEK